MEVTSLENIARAENDIAITTAKNFPRSISKFRQDAMTMATIDAEVAASCFYKLSRGGKTIEGPSVRLAEIVASAWGNFKFGARIIEEGERYVVAQGVAHDLEKNVSTTVEIRRRITDKNGVRFGDDMIAVTCNAASSIALRNAVFKAVPFTYVKIIFEQAKRVAIGDVKTISLRRQQMVEQFSKMGVTVDMLLTLVEKVAIEDIGLTEIETLLGVFTAIKDGDTTIEEQFGEPVQLTPEEIEAAKTAKKKRAALNKALLACETREQHEAACAEWFNNGGAAWESLTHLRPKETFKSLADEHLARIATTEKTLPTQITNAKNKEEFYKLLEEIGRHKSLDTQEVQDAITAAGRGLGLSEYFASEEDEGEPDPGVHPEPVALKKEYADMTPEERRAETARVHGKAA